MDAVKNYFKDKTLGFYLGFGTGISALIVDIIFLATDVGDRTFSWFTFILILAGVACQALACVKDWRFLPALPAICYAAAIGKHWAVGLETLSDIWNNVNFIGGNASAVVAFGILFMICMLCACASCFMEQRKTVK